MVVGIVLVRVCFLQIIQLEQLAKKILTDSAQRDQERVALIGVGINCCLLPTAARTSLLPGRNQVAPVLATGAEMVEMDLGPLADVGKNLEIHHR